MKQVPNSHTKIKQIPMMLLLIHPFLPPQGSPHSQRQPSGSTPTLPLIAPASLPPSNQLERAAITPAITRTSARRHERIYLVCGRQRLQHSHQQCYCLPTTHSTSRGKYIFDLQIFCGQKQHILTSFSPSMASRLQRSDVSEVQCCWEFLDATGHQLCCGLPTARIHLTINQRYELTRCCDHNF